MPVVLAVLSLMALAAAVAGARWAVSEGKWSGGIANRTWQRTTGRVTDLPGDKERGERLALEMDGERFWCETCGRTHPLIEHRRCREEAR